MSIFKRGNVYWFHFMHEGKHFQESTKQGNKNTARQMEAAFRTRLAKEGVGIVERKKAPQFSEFAQRFVAHVEVRHEAKPQTVAFYAAKLSRLLEFPPLASARLDAIDEAMIERYVIARSEEVSPPTVNRELATLRKMLRLAHEWRELDRVPRIRLLNGERTRDFVLSPSLESVYLAACPQPLHDLALLLLDSGLRISEALGLCWQNVVLEPLPGSRFGYLRVTEGKTKNARRTLPLTDRLSAVLRDRLAASDSPLVFANRKGKRYLTTSMNHLHQKARAVLGMPKDFVLHSLRHTMLTRLGESGVDAFTIMRIAGHSSITVSQRYVHPTPEAVERAFQRLQSGPEVFSSEGNRLGPATLSATVAKALPVSH